MEKIITCGISTFSYCLLIAQPTTISNHFATQLRELINYSKSDFKNIPENYKLEGSISNTIEHTGDDDKFFRSVMANKVSAKEANGIIAQLTQKIKLALGDGYEYSNKPDAKNPNEITFLNKCKGNSEVIRLSMQHSYNKYDVYVDVMNKKLDTSLVVVVDIFKKTKKIIVDKLGVDEDEVTLDASFTNDLGADSLDTIELLMEFEKEFNISIPDRDCECILTVGQAVTYLKEHYKK